MALLELSDVEARYGPVRALHGVSLAVDEGQIVAVLGANGAGKTTTLRAISGIGQADRRDRLRRPARSAAAARRRSRSSASRTSPRAAAPSPSCRSRRTCVSAPTRGAARSTATSSG